MYDPLYLAAQKYQMKVLKRIMSTNTVVYQSRMARGRAPEGASHLKTSSDCNKNTPSRRQLPSIFFTYALTQSLRKSMSTLSSLVQLRQYLLVLAQPPEWNVNFFLSRQTLIRAASVVLMWLYMFRRGVLTCIDVFNDHRSW